MRTTVGWRMYRIKPESFNQRTMEIESPSTEMLRLAPIKIVSDCQHTTMLSGWLGSRSSQ